jgi:hypothetical protein
MTDTLAVRVECYAGHRGEQEPRRFFVGERMIAVDEILDRWLAPDHRYFKLHGNDGGTYILRHDEVHDRWELTLYERGAQGRRAGPADP